MIGASYHPFLINSDICNLSTLSTLKGVLKLAKYFSNLILLEISSELKMPLKVDEVDIGFLRTN